MKQLNSILLATLMFSFLLTSCEKDAIQPNADGNKEVLTQVLAEKINTDGNTEALALVHAEETNWDKDHPEGIDRLNVNFLNNGSIGINLSNCIYHGAILEVIDCWGNSHPINFVQNAIPLEPSSTATFQSGVLNATDIYYLTTCPTGVANIQVVLRVPSPCPIGIGSNTYVNYTIATGVVAFDNHRGAPYFADIDFEDVNMVPICNGERQPCR